jgi:hypothetical protein
MNARTDQLRSTRHRTLQVRHISDTEAARRSRVERAAELLVEAGWFEHSDGTWHEQPEDGWPQG